MAKVFIEESSLTAIGEAIRSKTGKTELLSPASMATEITSITTGGGGDVEEIVLTGNCTYACSNPAWNVFFDKIKTEEITTGEYMFNGNSGIKTIPFDINFSGAYNSANDMFASSGLEVCPKINNFANNNCGNMFGNAERLREINDDNIEVVSVGGGDHAYHYNMCMGCKSLRKAPIKFINTVTKGEQSTHYYYHSSPIQLFDLCYALDEIIGLYPTNVALTSNAYGTTVRNCSRIKDFTFELDENGQPYVRNWKNQMIDLSQGVGAASGTYHILDFNSGITADKEVTDDATYQALKNDPDWFTTSKWYARYNHDSAVNTINSLPDVSSGSGNTIKFLAGYGKNTDGGAINTLTEEEIAVATAKGWTVSLV